MDFKANFALGFEQISELVRCLQSALILKFNYSTIDVINAEGNNNNAEFKEKYKAIVTGYIPSASEPSPIKSGLHVSFPNICISLMDAIDARRMAVNCLLAQCSFRPITSWENSIDDSLYSTARGMRMFGSRKVDNHKVDRGRVYQLISVINGEGKVVEEQIKFYRNSLAILIETISIRQNEK